MEFIKLLLYNPGIDKLPAYLTKMKFTDQSFNQELGKLLGKNAFKTQSVKAQECNDNIDFVRLYNLRVATNVKDYAFYNKIDVCVLQEICISTIPSYGFKSYIGGKYIRSKLNETDVKLLVIGTYNENIKLEVPGFLYDQDFATDNMTYLYPNDNIQVVKATDKRTSKCLYIVNIHNRSFGNLDYSIIFTIHLIYVITKIYMNDIKNSNIVVCGDNNNMGFFSLTNILETSVTEVVTNFVKIAGLYSNNFTKDLHIVDHNVSRNITNVLLLLFIALGFHVCSNTANEDIKTCNLNSYINELINICGKRPFNASDVFYYKLPNNYVVETVRPDDDICRFQLNTSAHTPLVITIRKDDKATVTKYNFGVPDNNLSIISDLVKTSENNYNVNVLMPSMNIIINNLQNLLKISSPSSHQHPRITNPPRTTYSPRQPATKYPQTTQKQYRPETRYSQTTQQQYRPETRYSQTTQQTTQQQYRPETRYSQTTQQQYSPETRYPQTTQQQYRPETRYPQTTQQQYRPETRYSQTTQKQYSPSRAPTQNRIPDKTERGGYHKAIKYKFVTL